MEGFRTSASLWSEKMPHNMWFYIKADYYTVLFQLSFTELICFFRQTSVNKAMSGLTRWPKGQSRDNELLLSQETFLRLIQSHRFRLNSTTSDDQLTFYTDLIGPVLTWIGDAAIQSQGTADQLKELAGYNMFISAKELFAAERGAGSAFYGLGKLLYGSLWSRLCPFFLLWLKTYPYFLVDAIRSGFFERISTPT